MKVTIHVQATLNSTQECHEWQQGDWQGLAPEIKIIRETGEGMSLRNVSQSLVLKFKKQNWTWAKYTTKIMVRE